jgi:deazaflavin-dependent oxidoreductase (nitroreductase family)
MPAESKLTVPMQDFYPDKPLKQLMFRAPLMLWRLGLGPLIGKIMLLLTVQGRKSGLARRVMVEYYRHQGHKYAIAAFGEKADWVKNLSVDPRVTIQTSDGSESALALQVTDIHELWDVLQIFMQRNPAMTKYYLDSLGIDFSKASVEDNKARIVLIRFDPVEDLASPQGQDVDLAWVWVILLLLAVIIPRRKK